MAKTVFREIKNSFGRYLAMFSIIALGTGFFAGLMVTKTAMIQTLDEYVQEVGFYDWRVLSTVGYDGDDVAAMTSASGVAKAEGAVEVDVLCTTDSGSDVVLKMHSITERVNLLTLKYGRMPQAPNECVVDSQRYGEADIGGTVRLSEENDEDTLEKFAFDEYTIVGVVTSPLYINYERGNTALGTGTVTAFAYIPYEGFDLDYYTEIYICLADSAKVYSDEYKAIIDGSEDSITELAQERADVRFEDIVAEANEELDDAQKEFDDAKAEYEDAVREYNEKRADAEQELSDAYDELTDAEKELSDGWNDYYQGQRDLETEVADAEQELSDAQQKLDDALAELIDGEKEYADAKQELADGENEYADGLARYEDGLSKAIEGQKELDDAKKQLAEASAELDDAGDALDSGKAQLDEQQAAFDTTLAGITAGINAAMGETGQSYTSDDVMGALEAEEPTITGIVDSALAGSGMSSADIVSGKQQLDAGWASYNSGLSQYSSGLRQYSQAKAEVDKAEKELKEAWAELEDAKKELADARAELDDGWQQLADARKELDDGWAEYNDGKQELADGRQELEEETAKAEQELADAYRDLTDGRQEIDDGWTDYYDGKAEADEEFADAEAELADGKRELDDAEIELADARQELADLEEPTVYVLGRDANIGYVCFENDSAIVEGIAKVFPLFFFLVAALVCITTMTRMVDEQRTQIGVLKALGFSSVHIMMKYMLYSGSASLLGCIAGFLLGSYVIPLVIWQAYCIMYSFGQLTPYFHIPLGIWTTASYLAISSLATWLACRNELKDVPAELLRPKAPKAGRRILLERVTFIWKRVKFLHKVSIRNFMRYRQRMFMMVVGIGGCTALLLTGYGIRDSIQDVVSFQYNEISLYQYTVVFTDEQSAEDMEAFADYCGSDISSMQLVYEGSMDFESGGKTKSVYVVAPYSGGLEGLVDLHNDDSPVSYPQKGEAVICTNLAENYGLAPGDTFILRDSDMNSLTLTVSGVFENYVYNYIYVSADTFTDQWGHLPEMKTVYAQPAEGLDVHEVAAKLLDYDGVSSVSTGADMEERVGNMMSSLNYIVWLIIICSGALAFIVLYNLTNININERIREIATIKVLGFYPNESASYVFRENMMLTALGALVGLPLGVILHRYVMSQIHVDLMYFDVRILPVSYLWSLAFTFLFALIVDLVMYFKLERINMAEALKSIE